MTPHFGTYHLSKNTIQWCQNTVQDCKMVFNTQFLATSLGVALNMTLWVLSLPLFVYGFKILCKIWGMNLWDADFGGVCSNFSYGSNFYVEGKLLSTIN